MSTLDFIKYLLTVFGYGKNITITKEGRNDAGQLVISVYAHKKSDKPLPENLEYDKDVVIDPEDDDEEDIIWVSGDSVHCLWEILDELVAKNDKPEGFWIGVNMKNILNDTTRIKMIEDEEARLAECDWVGRRYKELEHTVPNPCDENCIDYEEYRQGKTFKTCYHQYIMNCPKYHQFINRRNKLWIQAQEDYNEKFKKHEKS